jgi:hypothetical protein
VGISGAELIVLSVICLAVLLPFITVAAISLTRGRRVDREDDD